MGLLMLYWGFGPVYGGYSPVLGRLEEFWARLAALLEIGVGIPRHRTHITSGAVRTRRNSHGGEGIVHTVAGDIEEHHVAGVRVQGDADLAGEAELTVHDLGGERLAATDKAGRAVNCGVVPAGGKSKAHFKSIQGVGVVA